VPLKEAEKIEFSKVYFVYPNRPSAVVLNEFSFIFKFGTFYTLVGPSGAGKSTIIQLALRFYDPLRGFIFLDSLDVPPPSSTLTPPPSDQKI
jgi:ABC-type multidrug transport system fused ATPase/permease subunit